ncbi:MAG: FecR family protein [Opitutaceae bacterium]
MAAQWLALRQARSLTLTEEADFADWHTQDPRHAAMYSEVEASWRAFDTLADYPHSSDLAPDPDLLARPRRVSRHFAPTLMAAAAAIAIITTVVLKPWTSGHADITPAAGIAESVSSFVDLPDGSEIEINAGGEVRELFTADERRVKLVRGEAHFIVAKDSARPFIVEANGVAVRAVGTAFNVRFRPDAASVEVLVTEGTVQIAPPVLAGSIAVAGPASDAQQTPTKPTLSLVEDAAVLTAGQRTVVSTLASADPIKPIVETLAQAEIDRALSWQTGRLVLDATPLGKVVERFNQYAARRDGAPRLTVIDPRLGEMRISGRIRPGNIEGFVEALEANFNVVAERRTEGEIVLRRR